MTKATEDVLVRIIGVYDSKFVLVYAEKVHTTDIAAPESIAISVDVVLV
jgi:hypothetical protein